MAANDVPVQVRPYADIVFPVLAIPLPDKPFTSCAHGAAEPPAAPVTVPDEAHRPLYRWILGHHGAVCVWRLLAEALARTDSGAGAEPAVALYHCYSALLLYAGSCTRETYHTVIRARLQERSEAFSGTWARDQETVRAALRRVHPMPGTPLRRAFLLNRLVHMVVAHRLVPDDRSLLQQSGRDPHTPPSDADRAMFDEFFMVHRRATCRHEFAAQFANRLELIGADLAAAPVDADYPNGEVAEFQAELAAHLDVSTVADELLSSAQPG